MRKVSILGGLAAGLLIAGAPAMAFSGSDDGSGDGGLPFPQGFFRHLPPPGDNPALRPIVPEGPGFGFRDEGSNSVGRGLGEDETPPAPPPKPPTRAEMLDRLFGRLKAAADADEAKGIAGRVEALWMQSGSPTADVLMTRAVSAANRNRRDVAEALFDKLVELEPGWAEAWNRRATLRFIEGDDSGAMTDIAHVLALEPRHFGAMSGMASILLRHGEAADALVVLRRALALDPQNPDLRKAVDKLVPEVEGREL